MIRGPMGCLWWMTKAALLLAVFVLIGVLAFPWAVPLPGRGALTGRWVGEWRSNKGPRAWLYVNLQMGRSGYTVRIAGNQPLGKDAALCTSRRRIDLHVRGYTTAWSGKSFDLLLEPVQPSPPELRFDVKGTWDGDTLELREADRSLAERLNEPNEVTAADSRDSSQWIAATLRRGQRSEFDSMCATLTRRK